MFFLTKVAEYQPFYFNFLLKKSITFALYLS